uniref:Uncharacterized protein n=1 Tax=Anguilla anguilla TaxID=7936 RepID=A0A0E9XKZ0_ANGAN
MAFCNYISSDLLLQSTHINYFGLIFSIFCVLFIYFLFYFILFICSYVRK